jgi:hypothetical protein
VAKSKRKHQKKISSLKKAPRLNLLFSLLVFVIPLLVYGILHSSAVYGGDAGDLVAAIAVNGVPHPSGYPLYTLLGIVLKFVPLPATLAWKVGLGSAFFSSLAVLFAYLLIFHVWKNRLFALITSFTLAFYFPFWLYAQITEVMALQHALILALLYFSVLYREKKEDRMLFLLALLTGLSLTNNQTMVLMIPLVFLLVMKGLFLPGFGKRIFISLLCFFIGLLPYVYLPIAASFSPPVNWNNPVTLTAFLQVIMRQDYGWLPTVVVDKSVRFIVLKQYFLYLYRELTILGVLGIVVGIISSFWWKRGIVFPISLLLGAFLFGPFFYFYGASPSFDAMSDGAREKFIASSSIFLILFLPFGMEKVSGVLQGLLQKSGSSSSRMNIYCKSLSVFFCVLPLILFFQNITMLDLRMPSKVTHVLAEDILRTLPKNTVLIAQHDNVLFPVWYMEYALGVRSDVYATLPGELKDLAKRGMLKLSPNDVTAVLNADNDPDNPVHAVALRLPTDVVISESDYHGFLKDGKIVLFPYGLVLKYADAKEREMTKEQFVTKQNALLKNLSDPNHYLSAEKKERLWLLRNFPLFYAHAYSNTGYFIMYAYKDYALARTYFRKAVSIDDQDHWGYEGLGITYYQEKQYAKAREAFEKAVTIQPLNHNAYFLLYGSNLALKDDVSVKELEEFFKQYKEIYVDFNFGKTRVRVPRKSY